MYSSKQTNKNRGVAASTNLSLEASSSNGASSAAVVTDHSDAPLNRKGSADRGKKSCTQGPRRAESGDAPVVQQGRKSKSVRSSAPQEDRANGHRPRGAGTRATQKTSKISQSMSDSAAMQLAVSDAHNEKVVELIDNQEHLIAEMSKVVTQILFPSHESQRPATSGPAGQQALPARAPVNPPPGPVPACPQQVVHAPLLATQISWKRLAVIINRRNRRVAFRVPWGAVVQTIWTPGRPWMYPGVPVLYSNPYSGISADHGSRKYGLRTWPDPLPQRYSVRAKVASGPPVPPSFSHAPRVLQALEKPVKSRPEIKPSWWFSLLDKQFASYDKEGKYTTWLQILLPTIVIFLTLWLGLAYSNSVRPCWNTKGAWKFCLNQAELLYHTGKLSGGSELDTYVGLCFFDQQKHVFSQWTIFGFVFCLASLFFTGARYVINYLLHQYKLRQGLGIVMTSKRCVHYDSGADKRHMVHQNVDIKRGGDLWEVTLDFFSYNVRKPVHKERTVTIAPTLLEELLSSKFDKWGDKRELVDERFKDVHKILGVFNIPADRYDLDVVRDTLFVAQSILTIRRAHAEYLGTKMPQGF